MKQILLALGAALAMALPAAAQQYTVTTLTSHTNAVPASTTDTTDSNAVTLTKFANVGVQVQFQGSHADDTANMTFSFIRSVNGVLYDSVPLTFAVPVNGTTAVRASTNWVLGGIGYLKLTSIQNAATNQVTNIVIRVSTKPGN